MLDFPQLCTDNPLNAVFKCRLLFFSLFIKMFPLSLFVLFFFNFLSTWLNFLSSWLNFLSTWTFKIQLHWAALSQLYLLSLHRQCWNTNQNVNEGLCTTGVSRFKRTFFVKEKALRPCRKAFAWNVIRPRSPRYRQYTCDLLYFDIYVCVDLLPWTLLKL